MAINILLIFSLWAFYRLSWPCVVGQRPAIESTDALLEFVIWNSVLIF